MAGYLLVEYAVYNGMYVKGQYLATFLYLWKYMAAWAVLYLEYAPVKKRAPRKTTAAKSTTTKKAAVKPKKTVIRTESAAKPTASVSARKKKATKSESV